MSLSRPTLKAVALALSVWTVPVLGAIEEGRTVGGRPYATGGIGQDEVEQLKQRVENFSLQLIVSARSGAYLADTQVRIVGDTGANVLDIPLNAPWLLADLAPGTYTVTVTHAGQTQQRKATVTAGRREQIVIQFDTPADTATSPGSRPSK